MTYQDRANASTATIEDLPGVDPVRPPGHPDRWLGLTIGVVAAVIGFGFAGRASGPPSAAVAVIESPPASIRQGASAAPRPVAPFTLVSPVEGETAEGGVVSVDGVANTSLRDVQLAVVLGDAVIGGLDIRNAAAGPVRADIPVFAPGFDVAVRLEVSVSTTDGSTDRLDRALILEAAPRVSLWRSVATELPGGATELVVEGYARSTIEAVRIDVRTRSGRLVASTDASNAVDDERPRSDGGRRLGLGSFHGRIVVPGLIPSDGLQVEIAWRDGSRGSVTEVIPTGASSSTEDGTIRGGAAP